MSAIVRWIRDALIAAGCVALYAAPAAAQIDLSGYWNALYTQDWQIRIPGPDPVDYTGLPINAAARAVALSYSAEQISRPESQCLLYTPTYELYGPGQFTMWADFDPRTGVVIAWNTGPSGGDQAGLKIWMDGRAHPSAYAAHGIRGFTTGRWDGKVLVSYTTHMKRGVLRRNGVPLSDQATLTQHWIRHGNLLTIVAQIDDRIYLTEPYIYTRMLIQDPSINLSAITPRGFVTCAPSVEVAEFARVGLVPHYLPAGNPTLQFEQKNHGVPLSAALGGAAEMYPEYRQTLTRHYQAPVKCDRFCCGWDGSSAMLTLQGCPSLEGTGRKPPPMPPLPAPSTP